MTLLPDPQWSSLLLAGAVLVDLLLSLKPVAFIRDCLDGVRFPRDWWWTLLVIKSMALVGLLTGLVVPGVGLAANVGVVAYFCCAAVAHLRAGFLNSTFWINCLGFLVLAVATLLVGFVV